MVTPGLQVYSAAKSMSSCLADAINRELEGKVDVIDYIPAYVQTKFLSEDLGIPATWSTITAKQAADACFQDLGCESASPGTITDRRIHFKQSFFASFDWYRYS